MDGLEEQSPFHCRRSGLGTPEEPEITQVCGVQWDASQSLESLADVAAKPLSLIFEQSWLPDQVPDDLKKANFVSIFEKGRKEDPGNYQPVNLASVSGKTIEENTEALFRHVVEREVV